MKITNTARQSSRSRTGPEARRESGRETAEQGAGNPQAEYLRSLAKPGVPNGGATAVRPLPGDLASAAEKSLGCSFSDVRIDASPEAAVRADAHGATALAVDRTILVGAAFPGAGTPLGRTILAHELAHLAQSGGPQFQAAPTEGGRHAGAAAEREADSAAGDILAGRPARVTPGAVAPGEVARWASSEHEEMGCRKHERAFRPSRKVS